ncbi:MAG: HAD-IIIA family hydrolase [Candidatus Acidiferrum sp.]|jgi:D-glycero-D-manno-heptose 1,7-bisphosphate phosphatase
MPDPLAPSQPQRFVLLGRDGVINRRVPRNHLTSWEQFEFLPRALAALRFLAENGYAALVISNQACVGEKLLTTAQLESITQRFLTEVALAGGNIRQVYYCVHRAKDNCACRLPQPSCIHRAQLDFSFVPQATYFVGDSPEHMRAAASAGCPAVLLRRDAFLERPAPGEGAGAVASNLYEAAEMIVARQRREASWMQSPSTADGRLRSTYAVNH